MILIKTDGNGNLQWAKTYGGTLDDSARAIVQTSDGGYITGTYDIFLIKTDSSGKNIVVAGHMGAQTKIGLTRFMRRMITDT